MKHYFICALADLDELNRWMSGHGRAARFHWVQTGPDELVVAVERFYSDENKRQFSGRPAVIPLPAAGSRRPIPIAAAERFADRGVSATDGTVDFVSEVVARYGMPILED